MSYSFQTRQADIHSPYLAEAAKLHVNCIPSTLTSHRGKKTTEGLYRLLLHLGHTGHFAMDGNNLVGGLFVMRHARRRANFSITMYRPWSWSIALRKLGVHNVFAQLLDQVILQRAARRRDPHDYIIALYVSDSSRRLGVARNLLQIAIADATARGVGLVVDTALMNDSAKNLYESLGFVQSKQTRLSVQLTLGLG